MSGGMCNFACKCRGRASGVFQIICSGVLSLASFWASFSHLAYATLSASSDNQLNINVGDSKEQVQQRRCDLFSRIDNFDAKYCLTDRRDGQPRRACGETEHDSQSAARVRSHQGGHGEVHEISVRQTESRRLMAGYPVKPVSESDLSANYCE